MAYNKLLFQVGILVAGCQWLFSPSVDTNSVNKTSDVIEKIDEELGFISYNCSQPCNNPLCVALLNSDRCLLYGFPVNKLEEHFTRQVLIKNNYTCMQIPDALCGDHQFCWLAAWLLKDSEKALVWIRKHFESLTPLLLNKHYCVHSRAQVAHQVLLRLPNKYLSLHWIMQYLNVSVMITKDIIYHEGLSLVKVLMETLRYNDTFWNELFLEMQAKPVSEIKDRLIVEFSKQATFWTSFKQLLFSYPWVLEKLFDKQPHCAFYLCTDPEFFGSRSTQIEKVLNEHYLPLFSSSLHFYKNNKKELYSWFQGSGKTIFLMSWLFSISYQSHFARNILEIFSQIFEVNFQYDNNLEVNFSLLEQAIAKRCDVYVFTQPSTSLR